MARIRVLVPDKTLWTVGGIQGTRVGPRSPARGRRGPRAASGLPPGATGGCSSEHPPWCGVNVRQDGEEPWASPWTSPTAPGQLGEERGSDSRGHEEKGVLIGVHDGLQAVHTTDQEKACDGEDQSEGQAASGANAPPSPGLRRAPTGRDGASPGFRARGARPGWGAEKTQSSPCSQGSEPPWQARAASRF